MTNEKILEFLHIPIKQKFNKTSMKTMFWMNIGFSVLILLYSLVDLLDVGFLFIIYVLVTNVALYLALILIKTPLLEPCYDLAAILVTTITLLWGWYLLALRDVVNHNFSLLTWFHVAVATFFLFLTILLSIGLIWEFNLLKKHTYTETIRIIRKKIPFVFVLTTPFVGSPMIYLRSLEDSMAKIGLGISFLFWILLCGYFLMLIGATIKLIIMLKYKVYKWKIPVKE